MTRRLRSTRTVPFPGEPSLEMLVEMRATACDDDELPNHLRWVVVPFRRRATAPRITRPDETCAKNRASEVHVALPQAGHVGEPISKHSSQSRHRGRAVAVGDIPSQQAVVDG